jgi:hypothetical protein
MPLGHIVPPSGQERQSLLESAKQLARRKEMRPGRGKLDSQRQPFEPVSGCRYGRQVRGGNHRRTGCPGSIDEEIDGWSLHQLSVG